MAIIWRPCVMEWHNWVPISGRNAWHQRRGRRLNGDFGGGKPMEEVHGTVGGRDVFSWDPRWQVTEGLPARPSLQGKNSGLVLSPEKSWEFQRHSPVKLDPLGFTGFHLTLMSASQTHPLHRPTPPRIRGAGHHMQWSKLPQEVVPSSANTWKGPLPLSAGQNSSNGAGSHFCGLPPLFPPFLKGGKKEGGSPEPQQVKK